MTAAERPSEADVEAIGWSSGDVAENTEWAREVSVEWGERVFCRLDREQSRTDDGTRLLWTVYRAPAPTPREEGAT